MKKYLLSVAVILALVILTMASIDHYQDYQKKPVIVVAQVDTEKQQLREQVEALDKQSTETLTENTRLLAECEKGKVAYEKLTPFAKTQAQVPNCSPVQ